SGNELIPMLFLSFAADDAVAPRSTVVAYAHQALVFLGLAIALYALARRYYGNEALAVGVTLIWMVLPSTIVTAEFLSTRGYMEGMLLALGAWVLAQMPGVVPLVGCLVLTAAAFLAKELYPTALSVALGLMFLAQKRWRALAALIAVCGGYAAYRI